MTSHVLHVALSFSQIYLSWKSGPAEVKHWKDMMGRPRTAVSQWHALKAWGAQWSACLQCFSPQNSTSAPQHICPHTRLQCWAADNVCHLFVLRPLWYPLPSVLGTPFLNFTLVKFLIPTLPPLIPLSELKNVFDVFTHFPLVPLWELVVHLSRYPSVFLPPCQTSPIFNIRAAPLVLH